MIPCIDHATDEKGMWRIDYEKKVLEIIKKLKLGYSEHIKQIPRYPLPQFIIQGKNKVRGFKVSAEHHY